LGLANVLHYFFAQSPKEDMIVEKVRARDAVAAATISGLEAEHAMTRFTSRGLKRNFTGFGETSRLY
jgi:hypothetical protein